jgi:hypothetical protein
MREATSCPTGHQTDRTVRRAPLAFGRNSRNKAPSTGRFPPTPVPSAAKRPHVPIQVGPAPTAIPKTPARKRVMLNANRRPMTSDPIPQKHAPMQRPMKSEQVVYLTFFSETPNVVCNEGSVNATPWSQRLHLSVNPSHISKFKLTYQQTTQIHTTRTAPSYTFPSQYPE